ncbi:hypothetical protein AJ78_06700 [Emergomyces pasteurianus Ep9510]|uniref:Uncharacterized protein n=1 Tax=Emergomyces pasteurianus Ep9510 TaxID=1447872 RepID=A0A1J9P8H0_9EURO|nr:hypothetical protein AJ78_06700 [Emergomyces pasteurianus Ep9510]
MLNENHDMRRFTETSSGDRCGVDTSWSKEMLEKLNRIDAIFEEIEHIFRILKVIEKQPSKGTIWIYSPLMRKDPNGDSSARAGEEVPVEMLPTRALTMEAHQESYQRDRR